MLLPEHLELAAALTDRFWRYLPSRLRQILQSDVRNIPWMFCLAVGAAVEALVWDVRLLKARGIAQHLSGNAEYYGSGDRQNDLQRIGMARLVGKRQSESFAAFEARMAAMGSDAERYGTKSGIIAEVERTGLTVTSFVEMSDDSDRWIMLSFAGAVGVPVENQSAIYSIAGAGEQPEGQRGTRVFSGEGEMAIFMIDLAAAPGVVWSADEVVEIVARVKPAYTRGYVKMPGAEVYTEVT